MVNYLNILNENGVLIAKALSILTLGILIGYITKKIANKTIDKYFLKKIFKKDINSYETSLKINNFLGEVIQWSIIILILNYSLVLLNFNFLSNFFEIFLKEIPKIVVFSLILSSGFIFSKIFSSRLKKSKIENKEEVASIVEIIIITGFALSSLEYLGIKATALLEIFKVLLYIIAAIFIIMIVKPEILKNNSPTKTN